VWVDRDVPIAIFPKQSCRDGTIHLLPFKKAAKYRFYFLIQREGALACCASMTQGHARRATF
jgi:hypothetical protein